MEKLHHRETGQPPKDKHQSPSKDELVPSHVFELETSTFIIPQDF